MENRMKITRFVGTAMLSMLAFAAGGCDDSSGPEDEVHGTILSKDLVLSTQSRSWFSDLQIGASTHGNAPSAQITFAYERADKKGAVAPWSLSHHGSNSGKRALVRARPSNQGRPNHHG
jgi:hypothetical protein